jgi:hypothetical protein
MPLYVILKKRIQRRLPVSIKVAINKFWGQQESPLLGAEILC